MKPNMDLRFYAKGHGVSLWQVAAAYNVHEQTMLNRLRKEFTADEKTDFKRIVDKLASEGR